MAICREREEEPASSQRHKDTLVGTPKIDNTYPLDPREKIKTKTESKQKGKFLDI